MCVAHVRGTGRRTVAALAAVAVVSAAVLVVTKPWRTEPPIHPPHGAFVPSGPAGHAVVWAVGDGADGGSAGRAVAARIRAGRADRFLYLGDVYGPALAGPLRGDGNAADYRTRYAPLYGALGARTAPTPGNHEWPQRGEGYEPYWRRVLGATPPAYNAFRAGGWELVSLNTQIPHDRESAQVRWLRARLAARPGTCRLAFWHRPRFSAGRHGDQPDVAPLLDALEGHAVLVLSGHDHDSERLRPVAGVTQIVAGAGGHGRYPLHADRRLAFGDDRHFAALRLDLRPGRARLRFVTAGGRVLDDSTLRCRQARGASA